VLVVQTASKCGTSLTDVHRFNPANATSPHASVEMTASAEITEIEIGTADVTEVGRQETRERYGATEIEIASEVAEIREIQEIHTAAEEDMMTGRDMADGMVAEIEEIEVSTVKIELCWFIGADLMRNKMAVEIRATSPASGLEITADGAAEVHGRRVNQK
jgi:hypothetical protein